MNIRVGTKFIQITYDKYHQWVQLKPERLRLYENAGPVDAFQRSIVKTNHVAFTVTIQKINSWTFSSVIILYRTLVIIVHFDLHSLPLNTFIFAINFTIRKYNPGH